MYCDQRCIWNCELLDKTEQRIWAVTAELNLNIRVIRWFPKIRGSFMGVPIVRIIVFGVHFGFPLLWETTITPAQNSGVPRLNREQSCA